MAITVHHVGGAEHPGLYSVPQELGPNAIPLYDGADFANCTARNVKKDVLKAGVPASDPVEGARVVGLYGADAGRAGISVVSGVGNYVAHWEQHDVARSFFNSEPWHLPDPLGTPCLDTLIEVVQLGNVNFCMAVSKGFVRGRVSATIRNLRQIPGRSVAVGLWFAAVQPPPGEAAYKSVAVENVHLRTDGRGFWPLPEPDDDTPDPKYLLSTYGQKRWTEFGADPWQTIDDFYEGPFTDTARGGIDVASDPSKRGGFLVWTEARFHNFWIDGRPCRHEDFQWIGYEPVITHDAGWTPNDIEPPSASFSDGTRFTVIEPETFGGVTPPPEPEPEPEPDPEPDPPDLTEMEWLRVELFLTAIALHEKEAELAGVTAELAKAQNAADALAEVVDQVHDVVHPYDRP